MMRLYHSGITETKSLMNVIGSELINERDSNC